MAFQILIAGVDFSAFYKPLSLTTQEKTGTDRATCTFTLEDPPTVPITEQEIVIWESPLQRYKVFRGRIKRPKQIALGAKPGGGVSNVGYGCEIAGHGWVDDIIRQPPTQAVYDNVTTGFMFRDTATALTSLGFTLGNISLTGDTLTHYETRQDLINTTFDKLASFQGWNWWVDHDKVIYFQEPGSNLAPFVLNDANWQDICGLHLSVEPDTTKMANQIRMSFQGKYSDGRANVFNVSTAVTGIGTLWGSSVQAGATFRLLNPTLVNVTDSNGVIIDTYYSYPKYTIEAVLSDTSLRLSGQYQEGASLSKAITGATNASPIVITAVAHGFTNGQQVAIASVGGNTAANGNWFITYIDVNTFRLNGSTGNGAYTAATGTAAGGVPYVIENFPQIATKSDLVSIAKMAALTGDNGIYFDHLTGPGASLTFAEALSIIGFELANRSNPDVTIHFTSDSVRIPGLVQAGQAVVIKLTDYGIDTMLQIKQLDKKDLGGIDDNGYPLLSYTVTFSVKLFDFAGRYRIREQNTKELSNSIDVNQISDSIAPTELTRPQEISGIMTPTTATEATEPAEIVNTYDIAQAGPFYWGAPGTKTQMIWGRSWWQD